jgi:hypothetical protein
MQLLFRFTIGSADNETLKFWEPAAPDFNERLDSLKYAFEHGFKTSVSCEPMLDLEIHKVINAVKPYITDAIWLGKGNHFEQRVTTNGGIDIQIERARDLMGCMDDGFIQALYEKYRDDPQIKWKESIKKIVGIELATEPGLDI